jgi:hypothetical protein
LAAKSAGMKDDSMVEKLAALMVERMAEMRVAKSGPMLVVRTDGKLVARLVDPWENLQAAQMVAQTDAE